MRRKYITSLISIFLVTAGFLAYVIIKDYKPQLGLDLQGGTSIVLQPKNSNAVKTDTIDQAKEIIRSRVDGLGVGESNIIRQGNSIIIELPGLTDQARAEKLVGTTAQLTIREVLGVETDAKTKLTPRSKTAEKKQIVIVDSSQGGRVVKLGPWELQGQDIKSATAGVDNTGQWVVDVVFKNGKKWITMANRLYSSPKFPDSSGHGQIAIVLDGEVKSAATVQEQFTQGRTQISGTFTEQEAKDLALVLRYGSLPVELKRVSVDQISATLGKESLRGALLAGLVGLGLVLIYIVLYYRALGLVAVVGLGISGCLLYSLICYLGYSRGLALSLSGVAGVIVSIGITIDSYVVYFEKLKDEVHAGNTVRSSVDRAFDSAFKTIKTANASSLIAAVILYVLTVGAVRGFAFFLGLATVLDVIVAYWFLRPAVGLLGRSHFFTEMRFVGIASGVRAAAEVEPEPAQ